MENLSKSINLFEFPLNIVAIDDDAECLKLLQHQLKNTNLLVHNSPLQATTII